MSLINNVPLILLVFLLTAILGLACFLASFALAKAEKEFGAPSDSFRLSNLLFFIAIICGMVCLGLTWSIFKPI